MANRGRMQFQRAVLGTAGGRSCAVLLVIDDHCTVGEQVNSAQHRSTLEKVGRGFTEAPTAAGGKNGDVARL